MLNKMLHETCWKFCQSVALWR